MIKIDIISGFLGAGKTTLIKKIFETVLTNEKVVLIENEFGEIGIDGSFLKESGIQIKEINAGCICCSLVGDFSTSMKEVIDTLELYGAYNAANLDGGTSSQMVINGKMVNNPKNVFGQSVTGGRRVVTGFALLSNQE